MFKITVIVLFTVITAVILQQAPNTYPDNPVISHPYNIRTKPCNRRFNGPVTEDQFVPNAPQSLTQNNFIEQTPFLTPDDLLRDNRRSDGEEEPITDVGSKSTKKNCDDDNPDCDDNVITTTAVDTINRRRNKPLTSSEIEERTIQLIKDCITGKKFKSDDSDIVGDTRRSLSDNENHYSRDGSSEEPNSVEESDVETLGRNSKKVLLINNPRVCYACSSASNPSCLVPNRRTTIKYCNKDHASCVTKWFGSGASSTVIRDCASSCSDSPIPGLEPHYKKCSVCHSDLCNSAFSIKSYEVLYVLLIFTGLKYVLFK